MDKKSQNQDSKRLHGKGWFLTYPQCPIEKEVMLKELENIVRIKEYVVCQEKHQDGGLHIHAFLKLEKEMVWNAKTKPRFWDIQDHHPHVEIAKSWHAVEKYCKKEGDYISNIDIDAAKHKKAARNKELLEKDPRECVDSGLIGLCALPQLLKAKRAYKMMEKPETHIERKCYWIWGEPRIGKSYAVRTAFEDIYEKAMNKWWDGYLGEEVVLIDDFDQQGKCLGHYLKIWADNYRFNAEVKGDTIWPTYKKLIITSNYHPEEIFHEDDELLKAILGRFEVVKMEDREEQQKIVNLIK